MNKTSGRVMSSAYMQWAKTNLRARFSLASSGLMNYPLADLPVSIEDLEISGNSYYGYEPLQNALAAKSGVPPESVVAATGTSMANHLAMAALIDSGDEVLIEQPAYDPLISTAQYLGASVKRFSRRAESDFRIDLEEIAVKATSKTRLIVLTNLHNPTCAFIDNETLRDLGEIARKAGAHVLVDEVYLDALFENTPQSAFHLDPETFVITNSLTKVYGLSGLRCGWILAEPELARKLWRLNDLFGVIPAHAAERLSVVALDNLEEIAARSRRIIDANRELLNSFSRSRSDLDYKEQEFGTVSFPRLRQGSVDALVSRLSEKYDTSIVPGRFFEMPEHFRIGLGVDPAMFQEGLERLGKALDEISKTD
jgi:aspartate/methionine/tyrosine aminotransferase